MTRPTPGVPVQAWPLRMLRVLWQSTYSSSPRPCPLRSVCEPSQLDWQLPCISVKDVLKCRHQHAPCLLYTSRENPRWTLAHERSSYMCAPRPAKLDIMMCLQVKSTLIAAATKGTLDLSSARPGTPNRLLYSFIGASDIVSASMGPPAPRNTTCC